MLLISRDGRVWSPLIPAGVRVASPWFLQGRRLPVIVSGVGAAVEPPGSSSLALWAQRSGSSAPTAPDGAHRSGLTSSFLLASGHKWVNAPLHSALQRVRALLPGPLLPVSLLETGPPGGWGTGLRPVSGHWGMLRPCSPSPTVCAWPLFPAINCGAGARCREVSWLCVLPSPRGSETLAPGAPDLGLSRLEQRQLVLNPTGRGGRETGEGAVTPLCYFCPVSCRFPATPSKSFYRSLITV